MSAFEFIYAKRWFRQCPKLQSETRDNVPNLCEQLQPQKGVRGAEIFFSVNPLIFQVSSWGYWKNIVFGCLQQGMKKSQKSFFTYSKINK